MYKTWMLAGIETRKYGLGKIQMRQNGKKLENYLEMQKKKLLENRDEMRFY